MQWMEGSSESVRVAHFAIGFGWGRAFKYFDDSLWESGSGDASFELPEREFLEVDRADSLQLLLRMRTQLKRVLITGMSGTGKSAVTRELSARGYRAVDLDTPEWSQWVDVATTDALTPAEGKDWVWREDRVRTLLLEHDQSPLFVSGCAENMERLLPLIDIVILLSAPVATIMKRLEARSPGSYGSTVAERQKICELRATIEPLLRQSADHEIDTSRPIEATVDEILKVI